MSAARFTWDPNKAALNLRKHSVSFQEAMTVLDDPLARFERDWERGEQRIKVTGMSARTRVLVVISIVYVEGEFHIISARKAERHERKRYEESNDG